MRKKLIKKGQYAIPGGITNNTINWYDQLMKSVGMNFSQPSTFSAGLFNSKISTSNNLPLPKANMKNVLSNSGLGVPQSPDISKITAQGVNKLNTISAPTTKQVNDAKLTNFKEGVGEFIKSDAGKTMGGMIGSGMDAISANVGEGDRSTISSGLSTIGNIAMSIDPVTGMVIKGLGLLNQATSKQTNTNINSGIAGYSGSDINESKTFDGINRLLGNEQRYKASLKQRKQVAMAGKSNTQDQLKQQQARNQAIENTGITNQNQLLGGQNYSVLTAKKGATLEDIRNYIKTRNIEKEVVQNPNLDDNLEKIEVSKFQNGGSLIPSGALHKNKHKIESINPELDGEITKKGIPVISYAEKGDILEYENDGKTPKTLAEGGEIVQHAEIEKDEVILNLSLTKKLIELMKKDTPEAMIEAGKILARELMENTTDNTGLIEKTIGNEN